MIVNINSIELILSPRIANDVLALAEWVEASEKSQRTDLIFMTTTIAQSLKATSKKLNIFKAWKYKKYTPTYIMQNVSLSKISELFFQVDEVEGGNLKKKLVEIVENQLVETKQNI